MAGGCDNAEITNKPHEWFYDTLTRSSMCVVHPVSYRNHTDCLAHADDAVYTCTI